MPKRGRPSTDPIGEYRREATATRRFGDRRDCQTCGENRPAALISGSDPRSCARCKRLRDGKTTMDQHHPAGKANHALTVSIPVNDHRVVLNEAQYGWPTATRENPEGDPLLRAAACIRGVVDTVVYQIQEMLLWIADLLEKLSAHLVKQFGRRWWAKTEFAAFAPKRKPKPDPKPTK